MNGWLVAIGVLLVCLGVAAVGSVRGEVGARVIALQLVTVVVALVALLLAAAEDRSYLADVALIIALLSMVGDLVLVRFLERWL